MLYIGWSVSFKDISNTPYVVYIYKSPGSSSGTIIPLTPSKEPFMTQEEYGDNVFQPVRIQTGYIRIVTSDTTLMEQLMPSSPTDRLVRVFRTVNNTQECVWQGYIQQQAFTQHYDEYRWQIEFPVVSLLGVMKETYPGGINGYPYVSFWQIMQMAFKSVTIDVDTWQSKPITKVSVARFTTGVKIYSQPQIMDVPITTMPDPYYRRTNVYWEELEVRFNELFFNNDSIVIGDTETPHCNIDSYYTILEKILRPFGMTIREDGTNIIITCFGMAYAASGRHTAAIYDGNELLGTSYSTSPSTDRVGTSDVDTIAGITRTDAKQTVSYILPSNSTKVTTKIARAKDVLMASMPEVRLDGEVYAQRWDIQHTTVQRIWQLHDPSASEHPLEQFKFYGSSEEYDSAAQYYHECDYESFRSFVNSTGIHGDYHPIGACPCLVNYPDEEDNIMHSVIFMRLLWSSTQYLNDFVPYELKTFIDVNSSVVDNMWAALSLELYSTEPRTEDYTLRIQIINNGQYYTENDTWSDSENVIAVSITDCKIYSLNPEWATNDVKLINIGNRSGEFTVRVLQGKEEPGASIGCEITIEKIELKLVTPNINNKYYLGFSDNRDENVYSKQSDERNVKSISLEIGTNMGNENSPSFIYCPNNTVVDYYKNSYGFPIMSIYIGTSGTSDYREYQIEERLLKELSTYYQQMRHTRSLAARPFIRKNCLYLIDGLYYMAIEKKRSWVDNSQEIKFIEVAPTRT